MPLHHITHLTLQPIRTYRPPRPRTPPTTPAQSMSSSTSSTTTTKKRSRDFLPNSNNDDADAGDEQTIVHSPVSYTPPVSPGPEKRVRSRGSYGGSYREEGRGSYREERDVDGGAGGGGTPSGSPPRNLERVTDSLVQREREQGRDHNSPGREQSPGLRGRGSSYDNHHDLDLEPASHPPRDRSPTSPPRDRSPSSPPRDRSPSSPPRDRSPSSPPRDRSPTSPPRDARDARATPPSAQPQPIPFRDSTTPSPSPPPHEPRQFQPQSQPQSQTPPSPPSPSPQNQPPSPPPPQSQSQTQPQPAAEPTAQKEAEKEPAAPETDNLLLQLPPHDWPSFLTRFTAALHAVGDEKERIARELDMWNWMYEIWSTSRDRDDTRRLSREMATMVQWTQMKEEELERAREEHTRSMLAISSVLGIAPSGGPPGRR